MNKQKSHIKSFFQSDLFKNSFWGTIANIIQNVLLSVFFIILARKYPTEVFGNYIIANTIYSIIISFSTLGLGHWFIREIVTTGNKDELIGKFFKIQLIFGAVFYFINIILCFSLYDSILVRQLSIFLGINILFDNIINSIKSLNIANAEQRKTFIILVTEASLKCALGFIVFFYNVDIVLLSFVLIVFRIITLNLFVNYGSGNRIVLSKIWKVKISYSEFKQLVLSNWSFVVISSISVVNWRIGNIFVSKFLTLKDVASYEINFKLLSIFYLIPIIVTYSIYPKLVQSLQSGISQLKQLYNRAFYLLTLYGLMCFTFVYSFSNWIIPFLFGSKYSDTYMYCNEMFLIMLIFPTIFLQANMLLTMKLEKLDMLCNIVSLSLNILICITGLLYFKSLSVINYAIFSSFYLFHLIQDYILLKRKILNLKHVLIFNFYVITIVFLYKFGCFKIGNVLFFISFWAIIILIFALNIKKIKVFFIEAETNIR